MPPAEANSRNVIVTGAGNGLGLAIARRFASENANVLLVDKDPVVSQRIGEIGLPAEHTFALLQDLAEPASADAVFEFALKTIGLVDVLINNAAWSFHKPLTEVTQSEFDRLIAVNQRTPFFLAQRFVKQLVSSSPKPRDPVILNIASVNALVGNPGLVAYAGTKGALVAMTRTLAVELRDTGIRVNAISPGAVKTHVTSLLIDAGTIDVPALLSDYLVKRFATCEEVAELAAYLCGPAATFVNGVNWVIDGGYVAR
jgi:glucose 1-dehydrogenase